MLSISQALGKKIQNKRLRDFVRNFRECKTQAQQREIITQELGIIRNSIQSNQEKYRIRNIQKLIFINIHGFDTEFGQMECLRLMTESKFKQNFNSGLSQLLNEKSQVLMMATNRMLIDLNDPNEQIAALPLTLLGELSTDDMCRAMSSEVAKIIASKKTSNFIKKKAILASCQILKKSPDTLDDFEPVVLLLLTEKDHINATIQLILTIIQIAPEKIDNFKSFVSSLITILKGLLTNYNQESNFGGISDPFLQVNILRLFQVFGKNDEDVSKSISDILAQVVTNTTARNNSANLILYQNVKTIIGIKSTTSLQQLAVATLSKFLNYDDPNSKYVSLLSLQQISQTNVQLIITHQEIILDLLTLQDTSIQSIAIQLLYAMINPQNIKLIIKNLINFILDCDHELMGQLTLNICRASEKFAPTIKWFCDTFIKVLQLCGNYVRENSISFFQNGSFLNQLSQKLAIFNNISLQSYFTVWKKTRINKAICKLVSGVLGNLLKQLKAKSVLIKLFNKLKVSCLSNQSQEIGINTLIKITSEYPQYKQNVEEILINFMNNNNLETQQRTSEYLQFLRHENSVELLKVKIQFQQIFEKPPTFTNFRAEIIQRPIRDEDQNLDVAQINNLNQNPVNFLNEDLFEANNQVQATSQQQPQQQKINLLDDLFDTQTEEQKPSEVSNNNIKNIYQDLNLITNYQTNLSQQVQQSQNIQKNFQQKTSLLDEDFFGSGNNNSSQQNQSNIINVTTEQKIINIEQQTNISKDDLFDLDISEPKQQQKSITIDLLDL